MARFMILLCVLILSLPATAVRAQTAPYDDSLASEALGRTVFHLDYRPADTSRVYPVLLLLHGFGGDFRDWSELTEVGREVEELPVVIVMPDGDTSWYVNSPVEPAVRYEDYIVHELLPAALQRYEGDSAAVGIAGLSMGGYGAVVLGLRHPDRFMFIGALSGSLDLPYGILALESHGRGGFRRSLERSFGSDTTRWAAYDPAHLLAGLPDERVPYLYLANGTEDGFTARMEFYRRFVHAVWTRGLSYEYHEAPGKHDWEYWGRAIGPLLRRFVELAGGE